MWTKFRLVLAAALIAAAAWPIAVAAQSGTPTLKEISWGEASAPLEVIEYASFSCPHCAAFHTGDFARFKAEYIDTGKVRLIYRDFFSDQNALFGSVLAHCGGAQRFHEVADLLYARQAEWTAGDGQDGVLANLAGIGAEAGLDPALIAICYADPALSTLLIEAFHGYVNVEGIKGTPAFVIDGTVHYNPGYDQMKALLDAALGG